MVVCAQRSMRQFLHIFASASCHRSWQKKLAGDIHELSVRLEDAKKRPMTQPYDDRTLFIVGIKVAAQRTVPLTETEIYSVSNGKSACFRPLGHHVLNHCAHVVSPAVPSLTKLLSAKLSLMLGDLLQKHTPPHWRPPASCSLRIKNLLFLGEAGICSVLSATCAVILASFKV